MVPSLVSYRVSSVCVWWIKCWDGMFVQTICALLCGGFIVKREYFTEFSRALPQRLPPPESHRWGYTFTHTHSTHGWSRRGALLHPSIILAGLSFGVSSFIPEIDEPSLNKEAVNLCSNPERGRLFRGKNFVFFNSKQVRPTNPCYMNRSSVYSLWLMLLNHISLKGTVPHFIRSRSFS